MHSRCRPCAVSPWFLHYLSVFLLRASVLSNSRPHLVQNLSHPTLTHGYPNSLRRPLATDLQHSLDHTVAVTGVDFSACATRRLSIAWSLLAKKVSFVTDMGGLPRQHDHEPSWCVCDLQIVSKIFSSNHGSSKTIEGTPQVNSTNLVIKGIIAIKAMSGISNLTGHANASVQYSVSL